MGNYTNITISSKLTGKLLLDIGRGRSATFSPNNLDQFIYGFMCAQGIDEEILVNCSDDYSESVYTFGKELNMYQYLIDEISEKGYYISLSEYSDIKSDQFWEGFFAKNSNVYDLHYYCILQNDYSKEPIVILYGKKMYMEEPRYGIVYEDKVVFIINKYIFTSNNLAINIANKVISRGDIIKICGFTNNVLEVINPEQQKLDKIKILENKISELNKELENLKKS